MPSTRFRPLIVLIGAAIGLSAVLVAGSPAFAARPVMPMHAERFLTPAERATARASMTAAERIQIGHLFEDGSSDLVIGYASAEYAVERSDDGRLKLHPIGPRQPGPHSAISIPSTLVAASDYQYVAGTSLYISLTVNRTSSSSPYRFSALMYAEWRGETELDCCNDSRDHMSVAWSGVPAYTSSSWSSSYFKERICPSPGAMDVRRDSVTSNGATFSFREWKDGGWHCRAHWALMTVQFRETSFQNRSGTVAYTYTHTYGGLSYTVSLSASPGISVSPTKEQWPASVGVGYTY